MSGNLIPDVDPDEAERRQYAALAEALAGVLDLRAGLAEAINVANYAATVDHITQLLDLPSGLRSVLGAATSEDETDTDRPPHEGPYLEPPIPPLRTQRLADVAADLLSEADHLFDQELLRGSTEAGPAMREAVRGARAKLHRARSIIDDYPGAAFVLVSEALRDLDRLHGSIRHQQ